VSRRKDPIRYFSQQFYGGIFRLDFVSAIRQEGWPQKAGAEKQGETLFSISPPYFFCQSMARKADKPDQTENRCRRRIAEVQT